MPAGYANSLLHKTNATAGRKRSRSRSGGLDSGKDDLNYVDEDSDLSSGDDGLNTSDFDTHHHHTTSNSPLNDGSGVPHQRKRGRPKVHHHREDRVKSSPSSSASASASAAAASVAAANALAMSHGPYTPPAMPSGYVSDYDESGETKVDKYGRLKGGREYRVPTFKLPTRDETLFMFSKDPAALLGFRDSFVFLKKNVRLLKVHIDNVEKGFLVDSNLLRSTFRTREISVVTARSVFKQFGHRIIRKGRKGRDDYYYTEEVDDGEEDQSEEEGLIIKEIIEQKQPVPASSFLPHQQQNLNLQHIGKNNLSHKLTLQDTTVNELNWMHNAAVSARQFNTSLFTYRRANPTNYDLLTNVYQIPTNKQTLRDTNVVEEKKEEDTIDTLSSTVVDATGNLLMDNNVDMAIR